MKDEIRSNQDWHVSSTFSGGSATVGQIVSTAEALSLDSVCIVDKARRSSTWVRDLVDACRAADRDTEVEVSCGLEVEILDTNGTVELPPFARQVDHLFFAADRLPAPSGPMEVEVARDRIRSGELYPAQVVEWLVRAYANASRQPGSAVVARPFSLLPQLGIDPHGVHSSYARCLAGALQDNEASAEVSESWRAPAPHVVDCLVTAGVPVLPGSGAGSAQALGQNVWYCEAIAGLSSLARVA